MKRSDSSVDEFYAADRVTDRIRAELRDQPLTRATIEQRFGGHNSDGKLVAELGSALEKKLSRWRSTQASRQRFAERGRRGEIDEFIRSRVGTSDQIRAALERVGAAAEFSSLQPAVSEQAATNMILESHLIRARFTLGDLLSICGRLTRETALDLLW